MVRITGVDLSRPSFQRDFKRLPPNIRTEAAKRIAGLLNTPIPNAWRFHRLHGYIPDIFTIDVWPRKAYKASFNVIDGIAYLRRIGTHKAIDQLP